MDKIYHHKIFQPGLQFYDQEGNPHLIRHTLNDEFGIFTHNLKDKTFHRFSYYGVPEQAKNLPNLVPLTGRRKDIHSIKLGSTWHTYDSDTRVKILKTTQTSIIATTNFELTPETNLSTIPYDDLLEYNRYGHLQNHHEDDDFDLLTPYSPKLEENTLPLIKNKLPQLEPNSFLTKNNKTIHILYSLPDEKYIGFCDATHEYFIYNYNGLVLAPGIRDNPNNLTTPIKTNPQQPMQPKHAPTKPSTNGPICIECNYLVDVGHAPFCSFNSEEH